MLSLFNPNYFSIKIMMNQSHKQMNKPKSKDIEKHKLPQECHLSAKNIITFNNILSFHHSSLPSAQVSFKDYIFF